jgi:peptidoglycan/xylan/chitin deacetylase (PgdA/CDA1 family)
MSQASVGYLAILLHNLGLNLIPRFTMKFYTKAILLLSIGLLPLLASASSNYAVTETEASSHPNPLSILSTRERKHIAPKPQITIKKALGKGSSQKAIAQKPPKKRSYRVDKSQRKILYLTFDDGPLNGTGNVIRVLREEGVDATMFFIGKHIVKRRTLYRRALSMPNLLIANHTYSHANGKYARFYSNATRVVNDINRAQAIIGGAKYLRLAGRNVWRMPLVNRDDYALSSSRRTKEHPKYEALESRGYQIYGWDIEWNFHATTGRPAYGADRMAGRIERLYNSKRIAKSGKVILLAHDYMFRGQSGIYKLRELIHILRANGWEFATIDDYSSSTPETFMGKKYIRGGNPFDSLKTEWKIELEHMVSNTFISQGVKKYLQKKIFKKNISAPRQKIEAIEILLSKKETLPTEEKLTETKQ